MSRALGQQDPLGHHIRLAEQQDAVRFSPVPTGPARFLIIAFQVPGHVVVDHIPDIRFVDAHAEGVGGHHHLDFVPGNFPSWAARRCWASIPA